MPLAASPPDQSEVHILLDIAAKVEEVLSLQQQTAQHIVELRTGQAATQSALAGILGQSVDKCQDAVVAPFIDRKVSSSAVSKAPSIPSVSDMPTDQSSATERHPSMASDYMGPRQAHRRQRSSVSMVDDIAVSSVIDQAEVEQTLGQFMRVGRAASTIDSRIEYTSRGYILEPHCKARLSHDLASIVLIAVDIILGLTIAAWGLEVEGVMRSFSIFSLVFWSFDVCMSFFTGHYVDGELELRPRQVAKKYLRTWFLADTIIIIADFLSMLINDEAGGQKGPSLDLLRISKASRFLRLLRVLRLARGSEAFSRLMDASVYFETLVETLKPLLLIMGINHVLACAWWSVGSYMPSDTGFRWIHEKLSSDAELSFAESNFWFQYWTCSHWSMTQLAVGSMDVAARNASERAFTCLTLVLGMLFFSTLISTMSAMMMKHYLKQKGQLTKFAALRRFLRGRVKPDTAIAAQFQARKSMFGNAGKPMTLDDLDAVDMIPDTLQRSIRVELCEKHLRHPLFRWLFIIDLKGAEVLCQDTINFVGLAAEDNLFFTRADAIGAYAMVSGDATYILEGERAASSKGRLVSQGQFYSLVSQGQFFCEVALWCSWKHMGELTANTACEFLVVRASGMIKCLDQVRVVRHVLIQYGRLFADRLQESRMSGVDEEPNDMAVPCTDFASMLLSLPAECQQLIGVVAAHVARRRLKSQERRDLVGAEVLDVKACLMLNWEGGVERIVSIILLRLSDQEGRCLMRLGMLSDDGIQARFDLPGCKQNFGETAEQGFARFLEGAFAPVAPHILCTGVEREETWKESERMLVKTKYLKTVTSAMLACEVGHLDFEATQLRTGGHRMTASGSSAGHSMFEIRSWSSATNSMASMGADIDIDIYALSDGAGDITFVSWLSNEDMRRFAKSTEKANLRRYMEALVVPPEVRKAAKARFVAAAHAKDEDITI